MKTLQNNFTTPEQSKRLLDLGVPKWTADCYYGAFPEGIRVKPSPFFVPSEPCWSVGRLMEIIRICNLTAEKPWVYIERDNIHAMITAITDGVNNRMLDFSKLEK